MSDESFDLADWELERYRLGELPPGEMERVRRAVEARADLRDRLAALERDDAAHLKEHPPALMAEAIRTRLGREATRSAEPGRPRTAWVLRPAVAAVLGLGLVAVGLAVLQPSEEPASPDTGPASRAAGERTPENRIKGLLPHLILFRQTESGPKALPNGAGARRGDVVQIAYNAIGRPYGVIISADGRGELTLHLPRNGSSAAPLEGGGPVALESAFALDDAPLFERFYFVTSGASFDVAPVMSAIRQAHVTPADPADVTLPPSFEVSTFILRKETT